MSSQEVYQREDGRPKDTGSMLHEGIVRIRVDDDAARSNYTIHVEHLAHDGGVRCFHRNDREMVVSGLRSHLRKLADPTCGGMKHVRGEIHRAEIVDEAGLGLSEGELLPDVYERSYGPGTPDIEVVA